MDGPGLYYSGMMSTPTIAPSTHPVVVWAFSEGSEPVPISRGSVWFITEARPPPVSAPGQMKPTVRIKRNPPDNTSEPIVAAEAVQWVRIKTSNYYMASMAITIAGTDIVSFEKSPNKNNKRGFKVEMRNKGTIVDVLPAGNPVFVFVSKTSVWLMLGTTGPGHWATSPNIKARLLGYTSTVTTADDPYAMVYFVPGRLTQK
jgi:hypothetical protein